MNPDEYQELKALFLALRDVGFDERARLIEQRGGAGSWLRRARVQFLTRAEGTKYACAVCERGEMYTGLEVSEW